MSAFESIGPASSGTQLGWVNVADYVVGDGSTDDTAAYQAAVDDAIDQQVPFYGM